MLCFTILSVGGYLLSNIERECVSDNHKRGRFLSCLTSAAGYCLMVAILVSPCYYVTLHHTVVVSSVSVSVCVCM